MKQEEGIQLWTETRLGADNIMQLMISPSWEQLSAYESFAEEASTGILYPQDASVSVRLSRHNTIKFEASSPVTHGQQEIIIKCPDMELWDCEHSNLYEIEITLTIAGQKVSFQKDRIGFRYLEKKGNQVFWNGKALKLKGVCYRERPDSMEDTKKDLDLFAQANVNFIRSIYGSFSDDFLNLCDEMGFLVENTAPFYDIGEKKPATQDLPHCQEEFLNPVRDMLGRGNHVCVLIWSLGHDCAWGSNFREAAKLIRNRDKVRLLAFHLPMSIPEEEEQMDVWPVNYIDYRQPFDVCYDQMVIFHTPGAENEIGYMTGSAPQMDLPVLHEVWSPVACHNRDEIRHDAAIREFWGKSIRRFAEKSYLTKGCLGGAILAGVDEDGSFEGMGAYEWGILNRQHQPKPEFFHVRNAYSPVVLKGVKEEDNELILEVENRFLYTGLSEVSLMINGELQELTLCGGPGSVSFVPLSDKWDGEMNISFVSRSSLKPLSEYVWSRDTGSEKERIACQEPVGGADDIIAPDEKSNSEAECGFTITDQKDVIIIENTSLQYVFSKKTCLLVKAAAGREEILAGGPYLCSTRFLLGEWEGEEIKVFSDEDNVRVVIKGGYKDACDIMYCLTLSGDGTLETSYQVTKLYRHMPHTVKAEIGMDVGGLNEKGVSFLLGEGMETFVWNRMEPEAGSGILPAYPSGHIGRLKGEASWSPEKEENGHDFFSSKHHVLTASVSRKSGSGIRVISDGKDSVRLERAPQLCQEALVNDRDERMEYEGKWFLYDDHCGNMSGTETLSCQAQDKMSITFQGTGIRLYGPMDINYGMCNVYIDGTLAAEKISQYPDKVDFPGMSRGYEKRYNCLLFEVRGLAEGEHTMTVEVTGEKEAQAQNVYTSIDHAVLVGSRFREGLWLTVNQDYNYARLVRGDYRRPKVELVCGKKESFTLQLMEAFGSEGGKSV